MVAITVSSNMGGSVRNEVFEADPDTKTPGAFRKEVAEALGFHNTCLYLRRPNTAGRTLLGASDNEKLLADVGVVAECVIQVKRNRTAAELQQYRLEHGLTKTLRINHNIDANVVEIGNKVDGVADDVGEVKKVLCGGAPTRREGQTASERIKEIRHTKALLTSEAEGLRQEVAEDKDAKKLQRLKGLAEVAEVADGSVALVVSGLEGDTLDEKIARHKAQGKLLKQQKREEAKLEKGAVAAAAGKRPIRPKKEPTASGGKRPRRATKAVQQMQLDPSAAAVVGETAGASSSAVAL